MSKIVVHNKRDLVDHPYFLALDIQDIDSQINKLAGQTKVVNLYDNQVRREYIWEGNILQNQRALENIM